MDGIRIELDYAAIEKLEKAVLRAVEETVDELRSDVVKEQVMPYDSGDMQNNSTFAETFRSDGKIVSPAHNRRPAGPPPVLSSRVQLPDRQQPQRWRPLVGAWQPGGRRETFAQDKFAELYKEEAKL